jgi:tRNA-modifying protein YgfZ
MQKPLDMPPTTTDLSDLGAIRAQGPDAVKFLQGQLSSDVTKLQGPGSMLAGFHNPQGRLIALLRLIRLGPQDILAILPRELAPAVVAKLAKYVLRAKVKITDDSVNWTVSGVTSGTPGAQAIAEEYAAIIPLDSLASRSWVLRTAQSAASAGEHTRLDREAWRALDIAAGLPQVHASTSEAFVAQMLNLDVLGGIAFDKGCYTGQEIIARAHYRGQVKRRMQRFRTRGAQMVESSDLKIVEAVRLPDGRHEFLAVAPLHAQSDATEGARQRRIAGGELVESLPLPYSLPE